MAFWVNEDNPTERAIVHRDTCSYAKERDKLPENGQWLGPYETVTEALDIAATLGQRTTRRCQHCNL